MSKLYLANAKASSRCSLQADADAMLCGRHAAEHRLASSYRQEIRHVNHRPCFVRTRSRVQREGRTRFHIKNCLLGILKRRKLISEKRQVLACCRCTNVLNSPCHVLAGNNPMCSWLVHIVTTVLTDSTAPCALL